MSIIQAKVLWQDGTVVNCPTTANLNCAEFDLGSIRDAWITRLGGCCGGGGTGLTFSNPNDPSALKGVWVAANGQGIVIDATGVDAVVTACNACCGEDTAVPGTYNGVIPPIVDPATNVFCIKRNDAGTYMAISNMNMDYYGNYVTMNHKQNLNGVSTYRITAYKMPVPIGADIITAGECIALTALQEGVTNGGNGGNGGTLTGKQKLKAVKDQQEAVDDGDVDVLEEEPPVLQPVKQYCIKRKDDASEKELKHLRKFYGPELDFVKAVKGTSYYNLNSVEPPEPDGDDTITEGPCTK